MFLVGETYLKFNQYLTLVYLTRATTPTKILTLRYAKFKQPEDQDRAEQNPYLTKISYLTGPKPSRDQLKKNPCYLGSTLRNKFPTEINSKPIKFQKEYQALSFPAIAGGKPNLS